MITLFNSEELVFETNGLGPLSDSVSCIVNEEGNGIYELELVYPMTGIHYSDLGLRKIILAKPNPYSDPQPFRIYSISKPLDGVVTINAEHVRYDLSGYPVPPFACSNIENTMVMIANTAPVSCPFSFTTNKRTEGNIETLVPWSISSILGGPILDTYGGEYEFDKFNVKLFNERGVNRGVTIRYGKNLVSLKQEENCSSVYTGVYPYWYSQKDGLVQLEEKLLNTPGTYDFVRIMPLELSSNWSEKPAVEALRAAALEYITTNNIGVPKVSIEVEFAQLSQDPEFKDLAILETVNLWDTVTVEFPALGVSATARCIKTEYNALTDKYTKLDLGDVKSNLATTISSGGQIINKKVDALETFFTTEIDNVKIDVADIQFAIIGVVKVGDLDANYAHITTGVIDNATIDYGNVNNLSSQVATIASAVMGSVIIGHAQISDVDISSLNAGTIDTTKIQLSGADGRLLINGNRIQLFDTMADGVTLFERISIGDVNFDGSVIGIRIRGDDGVTLLYDEKGQTKEGFTDGYGKLVDASLDPKKIDISKVISMINANGSITINSSKIQMTTNTLDVEFRSITTLVNDINTIVGTQTTNIAANTQAIKLSATSTQLDATNTAVAAAYNKASQGVSDAAAAQAKADQSLSDASAAQTQADLGVANAATAISNAATAISNAATAQTQANAAISNAATAQTQANLGVTNAATAQAKADQGVLDAATAQTNAAQAILDAATAQTQANLGVTNADIASSAAAQAQTTANIAKTYTDNLALDSVITPDEKLDLKQQWTLIVSEATVTTGKIPAQAIAFGVDHNIFDTAYNDLNTYLNTTLTVFSSMTTITSDIVRSTWDSKWTTYYNARTDLLNLIASTAKERAELGVTNATTALNNAATAQTQANTATSDAATAQTKANTATTNAANAQIQANLGVANASTAQIQANTATSNAATAQTQATKGVTDAATAQAQANKGVTDAKTALDAATAVASNLTTNYSTSTVTATNITNAVSAVTTNITNNYSTTTAMNSAISISASGILSTVSSTYATNTTVNGKVSSTTYNSYIAQTAQDIDLKADKLTLNGYVTITAIGVAGSVTINGGNIKGGTLVLGGADNISGALTMNDANGNIIGSITKDGLAIMIGKIQIQSSTGQWYGQGGSTDSTLTLDGGLYGNFYIPESAVQGSRIADIVYIYPSGLDLTLHSGGDRYGYGVENEIAYRCFMVRHMFNGDSSPMGYYYESSGTTDSNHTGTIIYSQKQLMFHAGRTANINDPSLTINNEGVLVVPRTIVASGGIKIGGDYSYCGILSGNGDNATFTAYNMAINSWYGIGFTSYDNICRIVMDTRAGNLSITGNLTATFINGMYLGAVGKDISGANLNDYVAAGMFRGCNLVNAPAGWANAWFYLFVQGHDASGWCSQRLDSYTENIFFTRKKVNGVWGTWKQY